MTEPTARRRRWWKYLLIIFVAGVIVLGATTWYLTTASFQAYVRRRLVSEVERITGGRAEVGSFHVVPFHMQVEVRNITVHGKEAPTDIPLVHADSLVAQMKLISLLRTEFGFHSLVLEHPVVHIAFDAKGASNVPAPEKVRKISDNTSIEQLFALNINHLLVHRGELLWADKTIPLEIDVRDAALQMDYSYLRDRYDSRLTIGKVDSAYRDLRPFAWSTRIEFSLGSGSAEIKSMKWASGRSTVEANGNVNDFRDPHFDGTYDAHVDLEEAAAILRLHDLRGGTTQLKGTGRWSLKEFNTLGTLAFRDLDWQGDQIVIKKASATSDFSFTDDQIKLSKLQGKLFGGTFTGDAQVDNWLHSLPPEKKRKDDVAIITAARPALKKGEKPKLPGVQSGAVHLRLRDVSAGELAGALDVPAHSLGKFHPTGAASGSVDAIWRDSVDQAELAFALDVSPPQHPSSRELPITAQIQGRYRALNDSLELTKFNLNTPASHLQASGVLSDSSTLHFSISTSNLEEWRPLVTAFGGPTDVPFRVDGNASFNGSVGGRTSSPTVTGNLLAEDFAFLMPATTRTPKQEVHWDSLAATVQFSAHDVAMRSGTLRRGNTSADFEIHVLLQKGQFAENSPYTARVTLHNVDVAATAALARLDIPVSGTADLSLQVAGTRAHPQAQGHIHAANASAYGEAIEKFDADLRIAARETALNNIHLTHQDAIISGHAAYIPALRGLHLDLEGKNFDLARISQIQLQHLLLEGRADFTLQASGTLDTPIVNAAVQVRDFTVDHEREGNLSFEGSTNGGQLRLSGTSRFTHGSVGIQGTVSMQGNFPANISAQMDHLDADPLWRAYLGQQLTGHSAFGGTLNMQGPLRYPRQWTLRGDFSDIALDVEYVKLHNQDPVHFTFAEQTIHIDPVHFVGDGTDIVGHGSIHFAGARELDLSADGQADLRLLGTIDSNVTTVGLATVHMALGGTLADPLPQGTISIKNATANYAGVPSGLSELNGSLSFTRDRVHIDQLSGRTGGGVLDLKGEATYYNRQLNFNLTAIGKDVRLRYPPGVSSTATAELHWVGSRQVSLVSGDIMVTKLAVTPGFDFGSYLEKSRQSAAITAANSPLYNVKLDIAVRTAPELQMKTAIARLSGDADLRLRGSVARPSVLGRADILEGDATFNGIKFRLERGDITFANPIAIEPQVNLQATTHVRNYDLDVTVTGTPERLNVNYRSEPPLPKSDIIALLALGRTSEESEQLHEQSGQSVFNEEATNLIINQAINSTVSSRMQKLFGVSRIKIDPQGLTTETNPTARGPQVTIEQQFANNISLTYSTNVSQNSEQIIQGEYYVNRNISVVGTRDQNGVVSFDVRIRRRKK